MKHLFAILRDLRDRRGYGTIELMIMVAAVAAISAAVLSALLPSMQDMHSKTSSGIRTFGGSGF